jgi:hypothetical protein
MHWLLITYWTFYGAPISVATLEHFETQAECLQGRSFAATQLPFYVGGSCIYIRGN